MATLNLYQREQPHIVILGVKQRRHWLLRFLGAKTEGLQFKIPKEYTIQEIESVLQIEVEKEKLLGTQVDIKSEKFVELEGEYWDLYYKQLALLFNRHHPNVTIEFLRENVSHEQAMEIYEMFLKQQNKEVKKNPKKYQQRKV